MNLSFNTYLILLVLLLIYDVMSFFFLIIYCLFCSETISTEVFHLVQRQMEEYYEMMITDKKKIPLWARRLHLALKAYQVNDHII